MDTEATRHVAEWLANDAAHYFAARAVVTGGEGLLGLEEYVTGVLSQEQGVEYDTTGRKTIPAAWYAAREVPPAALEMGAERIDWREVAEAIDEDGDVLAAIATDG